MRSSALLSVMVLGLSALTAALPGLEIRAGNNRAQCNVVNDCSSGVCRGDRGSTTGARCIGGGSRGDRCNPDKAGSCNGGLQCAGK
ncbi:uncharacterized protein RAG0_05739 [Rhynchosporium agropyri]|uniref:Uncharacterized protein n=1 Tax=Rhynchosporium agropyri TaxID=914238 RepID=A0A1E1KED8_9HELO|nr:uncharacterized protein RAG0_05739 [Rhynchosporium agropyri]